MKKQVLIVTLALCVSAGFAQESQKSELETKDSAYTRTLNERATKIATVLGISDAGKSNRVHGIIVQQYRDLNAIHEPRDAQIKAAKERASGDKAAANSAVETARAEAKPKLDKLHAEFLAKLSAELSPEQVEKVKDGLTYGVVPLTYGAYLKMYPELKDEEKKQIMAWLVEARELAMDGSTSDEKHAVFGKYKGKINNYLSKAGYDAKKGEQNLKRATPSASENQAK